MKILAYSGITDYAAEKLKELGEVVTDTLEDEDKFCELIKDADILIIRSKPRITKKVLSCAGKLKIIGRGGVSISNVDKDAQEYCKEKGIKIITTPAATTTSVAELTLGIAISLLRNIPQAHAEVKSGGWNRKKFVGKELKGKSWGILGFGRIGHAVAKILKGFDVKIYVHSKRLTDEECKKHGVEQVEDFSEFLSKCDIISIHVPLTYETKGMINSETISKMKEGSYIINIARGPVVKTSDLIEALKSGKLAGAGIDVYDEEPPTNKELLKTENIVFTPHLGASTKEGQKRAVDTLVEEIKKNI